MYYEEVSSGPDTVYSAGRIVGLILFPFIIYGVAFLVIRFVKKRKPSPKEKKEIILVAIVLTVLGTIGQVAKKISENGY